MHFQINHTEYTKMHFQKVPNVWKLYYHFLKLDMYANPRFSHICMARLETIFKVDSVVFSNCFQILHATQTLN